jgi:antitoxin VapB
MTKAKIFWSGHSQAVRLPKELRFEAQVLEVAIRREGDRLILEPIEAERWPEDFWGAFGDLPADFERPRQRGRFELSSIAAALRSATSTA